MSRPVVLVHGFLATAELLLPMHRRLRAAGHETRSVDLSLLCIQDVRKLADQLEASVADLDDFDVVGVSQGGIIAYYWANAHGGGERARRFVTVGSPHRGSYAAVLGYPLLAPVSVGIRQLVPGNPFLDQLRPETIATQLTTVSVAGDPVSQPSRCAVEGANNVVVPIPWAGPLRHQFMVLSRRVTAEVVDALDGG